MTNYVPLRGLKDMANRLYELGIMAEGGVYPNTLGEELKSASRALVDHRLTLLAQSEAPRESPPEVDAVDPHAASTGTPSTRDKSSSRFWRLQQEEIRRLSAEQKEEEIMRARRTTGDGQDSPTAGTD